MLLCAELVCARAVLNLKFVKIILYQQGQGATLLQSKLDNLHRIAFNSVLLHLFATKIETNESWMMCEYAHLSES